MIKCFIAIAPGNKYSTDRSHPSLYDEQHVPVATHFRKLEVAFEHFSKLDLANDISVNQLVQRCTDVGPTAVDFAAKVNNSMRPFEFASRISRHAGGLPGFDCPMPELAAVDPTQYVRLFHPLHVKMAVTATEPLQATGSTNATVRKNGPAKHTMADLRAITLCSHVLKAHHCYLRSLAYSLLHASLHVSQTGGAKGRGTDISKSLIRWNPFHQQCLRKSSVTFVCDATSAFYTMIRQLVVPVSYYHNDLSKILDQIGTQAPLIEPLEQLMCNASVLDELISDKHLLAMLSETQRLPWFQIQGHPSIACTKTGSGQGGPLANLMYNLAMLPANKGIDNQLVNDGHTFCFQPQVSVSSDVGRAAQCRDPLSPAAVTAFVDDLSGSAPLNIVDCEDKDKFTERISSLVGIYIDVLHKRGMIFDTKPGGSAIMVSLAGPNSVKAKLWSNDFHGFLSVSDFLFQLVHQYKLFGCVIDATLSLGPEVSG